jgi:hypothetical protein
VSSLKTEVAFSTEMLLSLHLTTVLHIPEDFKFHSFIGCTFIAYFPDFEKRKENL